MFEGFAKVVASNDKTNELFESFKKLAEMDVLVGIPQEESSREGEKITNAELAFIHTNGSPLRGIPSRPIIEPAIEDPDNQKLITHKLQKSIEHALDGDMEAATADLEKAGELGQEAARGWFTNPKNNWPSIAPSTIEKRVRRKYRVSKYKKESTKQKYRAKLKEYTETGTFNPLIDTDELRKSIVYAIRKKG